VSASPIANRGGIRRALLVVTLALLSVAARVQNSAAQGQGVGGQEFPSVQLPSQAQGSQVIEALGSHFPEVAAFYGMSTAELHAVVASDQSIFADLSGRLGYACADLVVNSAPPASAQGPTPAPFPLSSTFQLHSRSGANRVIFLDFDGNVTTGTYWNSNFTSGAPITTPVFDTDGDRTTFSEVDLTAIQLIWQRVAEDFAPYDIDVTTADPGVEGLSKTSSTDENYGQHVCIGGSCYDWYRASAGGVSYVGSFNWSSDTPNFVFPDQLGNGYDKYMGEAVSHEVGHSLGLNHDGTTTGTEYYAGQGNWAPIMGVGYYRAITQWSKGEYAGANNKEDDLAVMLNWGAVYHADDHGDDTSTATAIPAGASISASGVIEDAADVDAFQFLCADGAVSITIAVGDPSPDLDVLAKLYDGAGNLITSANPTTLGATLTANVAAGSYYLTIEGVGSGDPLTTGYSDYASLGQYTMTGSVPNPIGIKPPVAEAEANPGSGFAPLDVAFSSAGSNDPDGSIVSYDWNFGDGSAHASDPNPAHTYAAPGNYVCTLVVTDNNGFKGSRSVNVAAWGPPPAPASLVASPACDTFDPSHGAVALSWQDKSSNEDAFEVEQSADSINFTPFATPSPVTSTSFMATGLPTGAIAFFRVRAVNAYGVSSYTNVARAATPAIPDTMPTLTATVASSSQINLTWNDVANETAFRLERSLDGVIWNTLIELGPNVTKYSNTGLTSVKMYYYRIRAAGACSYLTPYSAVVSAMTTGSITAPSSLRASAVSWTKVKLTWSDRSSNEWGFSLERSPTKLFTDITAFTLGANTTLFFDTTATAKTLYYYRMRAFAGPFNSSYTSSTSLTTPADSTTLVPTVPSSLAATALAGPVNKLTWKDNALYESGFKIQRSTTSSFTAPDSFVVGQNVTAFRDSIGLVKGTRYYYRVRAFNAIGNSSWTSSVSVYASTLAASAIAADEPAPAAAASLSAAGEAELTVVRLQRAAPNPFAQRSTITFELPTAASVDLGIFDLGGRRVATLASGMWGAGRHQAQWDGRDVHGQNQASGVFFVRLSVGRNFETRKLILAR